MGSKGIRIEVETTALRVMRQMRSLRTDQIPFAASRAFNRMAEQGQQAQRQKMRSRFIVRRQWVVRGIQTNKSHKRQWPALEAQVGSRDEFMKLQETGGVKRAERGSHLAIPTLQARRGKKERGSVARNKRPRRLLNSYKRKQTLFVRRRKGRKKWRSVAMFLLRRSARIKPRLKLRETVEGVVRRRHRFEMERALRHAIATAKRSM